jgi:hypothetical protein
LRRAWERVGVKSIADMNAGSPVGLGELVENWREGKRQIASEVFGIRDRANVTVLTESMVQKVIVERVGRRSQEECSWLEVKFSMRRKKSSYPREHIALRRF